MSNADNHTPGFLEPSTRTEPGRWISTQREHDSMLEATFLERIDRYMNQPVPPMVSVTHENLRELQRRASERLTSQITYEPIFLNRRMAAKWTVNTDKLVTKSPEPESPLGDALERLKED